MISTLTLRLCTLTFAFLIAIPGAFAASFSDVPQDHYAFQAVEFLKENGVIGGYADGTFKPGKLVNRAEALKIITAPLIPEDQLAKITATPFNDVPAGAWFLPYVEAARQNNIIDGPPKKTAFYGERPVLKAEYIKMLIRAYQENEDNYSEIRLPFTVDVSDPNDWYYPFMRYALSASMTSINTSGQLQPGKQLSRGETAVLLYRFIQYRQGNRAQNLLSTAENEIIVTLGMLDQNNLQAAQHASARGLIASRGALTSKPNSSVVKGALKVSEGFRSIVRAYTAGADGDFNEVVRLAGEAWNLATSARDFDASMTKLADQIQKIAKQMADSGRAELAKQAGGTGTE